MSTVNKLPARAPYRAGVPADTRVSHRNAQAMSLLPPLLCGAIAATGIFWQADARAATYYVTTAGADTNPGTQAQPWRSIAKANQTLQPGDTVLIGAGTYTDQIRPAQSGTSDSARITYRAAGTGNVVLTAVGNSGNSGAVDVGAIALGGESYVTVDGVNQYIRVAPGSTPFAGLGNFNGSSYCIINSVYFDGSTQSVGGNEVFLFNFLYGGAGESKYNVLRNSYITGRIGSSTQFIEDTIQVSGNAHHNLIEGNTIANARHVALNVGSMTTDIPHDNVIRNNIVRNPEHTALQLYNGGPYLNIVEDNTITASGGKPVSPTTTNPGNALEYSGAQTIFRYNLIAKGGTTDNDNSALGGFMLSIGGQGSGNATYNRIYNNTIVKNNGPAIGVEDFGGTAGAVMGKGKYFNNFIYDANAPAAGQTLALYWDSNQSTSDVFVRNVLGNPGGSSSQVIITTSKGNFTLASAASTLTNPASPTFASWNGFANVYDASPGFTDYAGDDFTLPAGNKYIDAGAHLTQVASVDTGAGTTLQVDDARFFQDGRGIPGVQPDRIAIGTTSNVAQISSVNYATNTITLASAVVRKVGDRVWLYAQSDGRQVLYGAAPDIGAYEYATGSSASLSPPANLRVVQ